MKQLIVAGVDEAGRGPLAGPVVTAAVILDVPIEGVTDSKKLSEKKRAQLFDEIQQKALAFAFGRADVDEIDALNIHHATLLAMKRAIEALPIPPNQVLIDGLYIPQITMSARAIVKGDLLIPEIGAASILAKVARDREMIQLDELYPGYGLAVHKGYPTSMHLHQLRELGASVIHRRSYAPVAAVMVDAV